MAPSSLHSVFLCGPVRSIHTLGDSAVAAQFYPHQTKVTLNSRPNCVCVFQQFLPLVKSDAFTITVARLSAMRSFMEEWCEGAAGEAAIFTDKVVAGV